MRAGAWDSRGDAWARPAVGGSAEAGTPGRAGAELIKARGRAEGGSHRAAVRPKSASASRAALRRGQADSRALGPRPSAPEGAARPARGGGGARVPAGQSGVRAAPRGTCGDPPCAPWSADPRPPRLALAPRLSAAAARPWAVPMEPHVLGAVLYWLLLPCTLLAGEWGAAGPRTELRSGSPCPCWAAERGPRGQGCERAGGRGDSPGRAALGARIPEA